MDNLFAMVEGEGPQKDPLASQISSTLGTDRPSNAEIGMEDTMGIGTVEASPEEQMVLEEIVTGIEKQIHGPGREDILAMLEATPELWDNIARASQLLLEGAYNKLSEQGMNVEPDIFLGENGAVQSTVEMVYELAYAAGIPGAEDSNQLDVAYMRTLQLVGEELYEDDDVAVAEAQQLMVDMEFGDGASDIAAEAFQEMEFAGGREDMLLEEDMLAMQGDEEFV